MLRWMLERGNDPNACDVRGRKTLSLVTSKCQLIQAVKTGNHWGDRKICVDEPAHVDSKLLLDFGAHPRSLDQCPDVKARQQLQEYAQNLQMERASGKSAKPTLYCPCGSNIPPNQCHQQRRGVPVHSRIYCPCKSGKTYARCCKARNFFYRETLTTYYEPNRLITSRSFFECLNLNFKLELTITKIFSVSTNAPEVNLSCNAQLTPTMAVLMKVDSVCAHQPLEMKLFKNCKAIIFAASMFKLVEQSIEFLPELDPCWRWVVSRLPVVCTTMEIKTLKACS